MDLTRQLASQLQIDNSALSLEQLLDRPQPKTVWILLQNFDAVLDRTELDPQFGIAFFDQLNALKNRPRCFLLCVTQKPYQKYHLYAEQIHRLSRLDLGVDKLTALTRDEAIKNRLWFCRWRFVSLINQKYFILEHQNNKLLLCHDKDNLFSL